MIKNRPLLLLALVAALCAGCNEKPKKTSAEPTEGLKAGEAPKATDVEIPMAAIADPAPNQSLYLIHVQNDSGQAIAGAMVYLLNQTPDGLYLYEPRRSTVVTSDKSPLHGRVAFMIESDSLPKYVLVGGDGFYPKVIDVPAASSQLRHEMTVVAEIVPILKLIVEDHNGYRVANGIITMHPVDKNDSKFAGRTVDIYDKASRTDDLGEVEMTRLPGRYELIATKSSGRSRHTEVIDWGSTNETRTIRLPEKSPGQ